MRIHKPRGITRSQIALVTVLGVFSGIYIWTPLFVDFFKAQRGRSRTETTENAEVAEVK